MTGLETSGDLMSPMNLFLQADIVVKAVMVGLLLASIWTWAIIFTHAGRLARIRRKSRDWVETFWKSDDIEIFAERHGNAKLPPAAIFRAGLDEWRRSTRTTVSDKAAVRERIAIATDGAIEGELDKLSDRLNILATVGSVAPFVGLFGTVWGIMRSFTAIAGANNTSLAVVAPGIAEALFATAIGLFAAIPAVIAYNRLTHRLDHYEATLGRFADKFQNTLSRELDRS
ncbi:protein TolQ [Sphingomicrobium marinum]|uniref:protein TolQ n=1 Tax=Sphingomicrobium marinum TaxID=1227950 RepID=UPI0022409C8F|nr:protein TolQ [Sphingomicrobium marinum]